MTALHDVDYDDLESFWSTLEPELAELETLQAVAERFTDALYRRFEADIILVRTFATVEFAKLPAADRAFVEGFVAERAAQLRLSEATPVLSLLGTRGSEPEWNDRTASRGHLGIPLLSAGFVGEIPMIARLLREIGFSPEWDGASSGFIIKSLANLNGVFFVHDARTAVDEQQRLIIPATDFVERYGVQSVFGFGGTYLSRHMFLTTIIFAKQTMMRTQAMKFVPLIGSLKAATTRTVNRGAIF